MNERTELELLVDQHTLITAINKLQEQLAEINKELSERVNAAIDARKN
jgi:hypothetical protein